MTTPDPEKLSALVDGELSYSDGKRLLDTLLNDVETQATVARYQTVRACLARESIDIDHAGLFNRIHDQLQDEPVVLAPSAIKGGVGSGIRRLASGGALAAGVAAAVIFGVNNLSVNAPGPTLTSNGSDVPAVALQPVTVSVPAGTESVRPDRLELESYLQEHENQISRGALGTGLPLATMVGYEGF